MSSVSFAGKQLISQCPCVVSVENERKRTEEMTKAQAELMTRKSKALEARSFWGNLIFYFCYIFYVANS